MCGDVKIINKNSRFRRAGRITARVRIDTEKKTCYNNASYGRRRKYDGVTGKRLVKNVKQVKLRIISYLLITSLLLSFSACGGTEDRTETTEAGGEETTMKDETVTTAPEELPDPAAVFPEEGAVISLLNEEMTAWVKDYKRSQLDKICDFTEKCEPVPVRFSWGGNADYTHLLISTDPGMSDPAVYLCTGGELEVEDLLPGTTYYWQTVCTADGKDQRSGIRSFSTLQAPRTMYIPGVSNVRDLGGKTVADGRRIKYGMVYRGADFAHITEEGVKKAVDILGVRTELDLRTRSSGGSSPLGRDVKYISVTAPYYTGVTQGDYHDDLLTELRVFADPENYPVYFHCSLGRDRTGTLAFILLSLLGADADDIYMDYEISFFSDMGGYVDTTAPSYMVSQLDSLKSIVSPGKKTFPDKTAKYLLKLGLTQEEIDAIRNNLLEKIK